MKKIMSFITEKISNTDWTLVVKIIAPVVSIILLSTYILSLKYKNIRNEELINEYNSKESADEFFEKAYGKVYVHIKGEVKNPGVYELNAGIRVSEAIEAAGGFTDDADRDSVNLAEKVKDEMEIDVKPSSEPTSNTNNYNKNSGYTKPKNNKSYYNNSSNNKKSESSSNDVPVQTEQPQTSVTVNINHASVGELIGVGFTASQASAIVEYRDYKGFFGSVSELLKVNGITQEVLSSISGNLTV